MCKHSGHIVACMEASGTILTVPHTVIITHQCCEMCCRYCAPGKKSLAMEALTCRAVFSLKSSASRGRNFPWLTTHTTAGQP
jgi:hypothetical protein